MDLIALVLAVAIAGSAPLALAYAGLALGTLAVAHAYYVPITLRTLDKTPRLVARLAIALMLLAPIGLLTGVTDVLLRVAALGVALVIAGRAVSLAVLRHLRRHGVLLEPTVILGGGTTGAEIARVLSEDRSYGATPIGFVGSVAGKFPLPVLGDINELNSIISRYEVRRVIVAFGVSRCGRRQGASQRGKA